MNFINSFQSEWLKKKRSLAAWLVIVGAFFTPSIILTARIYFHTKLENTYQTNEFWLKLWNQSWESMAIMMLPIGITLAVGLITQLEFKNNTWKQLHTTPQSFSVIFFAKLLVVVILLAEVFLLFNVGMYLSGVIPVLILSNASYPSAPIPFSIFWQLNLNFFIDCLPVLALQYLISIQSKNFLVPIGFGFVVWLLGVGMMSWEYSYFLPYNICAVDFLVSSGQMKKDISINLQLLSLIYFIILTIVSYFLYVTKKEKG